MAPFERQATITWEGPVREGQGEIKAGTGAFAVPLSFPARVASPGGRTSPEELLAAAHASCFAMALAATLARRGGAAARLHVSATVHADFGEAGLVLRRAHLRVMADGLTGLEAGQFLDVAREAESRCPVSSAFRGNLQIEVDALA